jgi:hypothetical protein
MGIGNTKGGKMLIKEVIKLYGEEQTKLGISKEAVKRSHDVLCDFFSTLVDLDIETKFKDRKVTVPIEEPKKVEEVGEEK